MILHKLHDLQIYLQGVSNHLKFPGKYRIKLQVYHKKDGNKKIYQNNVKTKRQKQSYAKLNHPIGKQPEEDFQQINTSLASYSKVFFIDSLNNEIFLDEVINFIIKLDADHGSQK